MRILSRRSAPSGGMASFGFARLLVLFTSIGLASLSANAWSVSRVPHCTSFTVPIAASAANIDLSDPSGNKTVPISGTFNIGMQYCEASVSFPSRKKTLQILVHGATYNRDYWNFEFEPDLYNYVQFAAASGFNTLSYDRLGAGVSDRPDPVTVVQTPLQLDIAVKIIELARSGQIAPAGRGFDKIIQVGHSLGSALTNGVMTQHPDLLDAAILTGYDHTPNKINISQIAGLEPAAQVDPNVFPGLSAGYLTTESPETRAAFFYGANGTFDPLMLSFDSFSRDTFTTGELQTLTNQILPAPDFEGDVLTLTGNADVLFCNAQEACNNVNGETSEFYAKAKSTETTLIPGANHAPNVQLSAPLTFAEMINFLERHGF